MKNKKNILIILTFIIIISVICFFTISKRYSLVINNCPLSSKNRDSNLYSQFFEDTILSIVFSNKSKGFYIDIGANDPDDMNVTKYFYLKGWNGINVEPIKKWYLKFLEKRPRDINLNVGISNEPNTLEFYRIYSKEDNVNDTLSTFTKSILESHVKRGYIYETINIPVVTLNHIIESNNVKEIDFIKIDIEGGEKEALLGIDLNKHRPKVFIIEATEPNGPIPCDYLWKDILVKNNYIFILNDGLNHYYVDKEHYKKLIPKFIDAFYCAVKSNHQHRILYHPMSFSYPFHKPDN